MLRGLAAMQGSDAERQGPGYGLCLEPHYAWVQRLFRLVPGARGYLGKEKLREADVLIRRYVSSRLDEAAGLVEAARQALASRMAQGFFSMVPMASGVMMPPAGGPVGAGEQALAERLRSLSLALQNTASDVLYADSGWAPVGAVQAVREPEIRELCRYDDSMIGLSEAILETARRLRAAVEAGSLEEAARLAGELEAQLGTLRGVYDERRRYLHFVTHEGLSAREALARLGGAAGGVVERARALVSRVFSRLGRG